MHVYIEDIAKYEGQAVTHKRCLVNRHVGLAATADKDIQTRWKQHMRLQLHHKSRF